MSNIIQEVAAETYICPMSMSKKLPSPCLGVKCMAWRYVDGAMETRGYCGLATSPFKIGGAV